VKCIDDDARYRNALLNAMPRAPHHVWTVLHDRKPVLRMVRHNQLGDSELTYDERVGAHTLMAFWLPADAPPVAKGKTKKRLPPPPEEEEGAELPEVSPNGRF
jgi:hypothetical protein